MRTLTTLAAIGGVMLLAGCAKNAAIQYQSLVHAYDTAGNGAYYDAQTEPTTQTGERVKADRSQWEAARQKLAAQKEAWTRALGSHGPSASRFYAPDAGTMAEYAALAEDRDAAEDLLAAGASRDDVTALAVLWNPDIRAAREKMRSKLEQYSQVAYLDDILLQHNAFAKQLTTTVGKPRQKEMMAMEYPFPDGLALKGRIVTEDVRVAERDVDIATRDVVTAARIAYYDYLFVGEAIRINGEAEELLNQMVYVAQAKLRVGIGKYHSVIMGQVELARLGDAILTLEEQREIVVARLNTLLDRRADAPLGAPTPVADDDVAAALDDLYLAGAQGAQELQKQRLMIARMGLMIEMATRMTYPDSTLGASYFEDRMKLSTGTKPTPPTFQTQRTPNLANAATFATGTAYVREAESRLSAMEEMLAGMTNMTELAIRKHHFGMDRARRSVALHRNSLLPQALQALDAASAAYQTARVDFVTLLDAERTLLRIQLGEQAALRDHRTHLAELDNAIGSAAPRKPLDLDDLGTTERDEGVDDDGAQE
ncbi:hypothetical protein CMK11_16825 [Candidatus Poribacteria bacterium]|nr:hypothetical protein [Candidatus Poribacteria bacterium]